MRRYNLLNLFLPYFCVFFSLSISESNTSIKVRGENDILSNFYPCKVTDEQGTEFRSAEHFYQFKKAVFFGRLNLAEDIKNSVDARSAIRLSKQIGRSHLSNVWYSTKLEIMKKILVLKFNQVAQFRDTLLNTEKAILIHDVPHGFWGSGRQGHGENHFGNMLMQIRSEKSKIRGK